MKKLIGILITILLVFGLSACSAASSTSTTSANSTSLVSSSLSAVEELALGTLKLEGTSQAVDKTQASTLLPLWQAYLELQSNNSTSTEEVNAVISQIQSSMTTDQTKAIENLKLTSQDLMNTMASLGISNAPVSAQGTQTAPSGQDITGGFQGAAGGGSAPSGSGAPPSGGGPQNSGGVPGGTSSGATNLTQSQIATMQASKGTAQGSWGTSGLIEKLISILEQKVQS